MLAWMRVIGRMTVSLDESYRLNDRVSLDESYRLNKRVNLDNLQLSDYFITKYKNILISSTFFFK